MASSLSSNSARGELFGHPRSTPHVPSIVKNLTRKAVAACGVVQYRYSVGLPTTSSSHLGHAEEELVAGGDDSFGFFEGIENCPIKVPQCGGICLDYPLVSEVVPQAELHAAMATLVQWVRVHPPPD